MGVASNGVAAAEQSSFRVPTESVLLSGTIFNMNELPSRKTRPTSMQDGRELLTRLEAHGPSSRQAASGGVGDAKRRRKSGSFAPSLASHMRNQRQDAFGHHKLSVQEEGRRAASAYTQGQNPRSAEATMYLGFCDPRRGGRLTRRVPVYFGTKEYGARTYPAASRPCFSSFDVDGSTVASEVLRNDDEDDPASTLLRRGAAAQASFSACRIFP